MKYGSVCSGIEAATVAWEPLGFKPVWFSEIEPFPCTVLNHHWPHVPNYGDMTKFRDWKNETIDILVGGTPCQSFSVAGLRKGLDDPRGNLMLTYLAIAEKYKPEWLVWENVPGVLSSNKGRDFGTFLGALAELGYGYAYRILDAQYFGVPQRRRRVFVVANFGDWRCAAAVLFEPEGLRGYSEAGGSQKGEVARTVTTRSGSRHDAGKDDYIVVNGWQDPCSSAVSGAVDTFAETNVVLLASGKNHLVHCLQVVPQKNGLAIRKPSVVISFLSTKNQIKQSAAV